MRGRFTLVELLVVIAVIALLLCILLPALRKARDRAVEIGCAGNLKQIGTTIVMYADSYDGWLPWVGGMTPKANGNQEPGWYYYPTALNWINKLLPFTNVEPLFLGESISKPRYWGKGIFWCAAKGDKVIASANCWYGGYVLNHYVVSLSPWDTGLYSHTPRKITYCATPSSLVLVADSQDYPGDAYSDEFNVSILNYRAGSSRHGLRFNSLCLDGHASSIRYGDSIRDYWYKLGE